MPVRYVVLAAFAVIFILLQPLQAEDEVSIEKLQAKVDAVLRKVRAAVVTIAKNGKVQGSGVIVTRDGSVVTHGHHGFQVNGSMTVILPDGRQAEARI